MQRIALVLLSVCFTLSVHASTLQLGFIADAGKKTTASATAMRSMTSLNVKQLVMAGDNLYNSNYETVWRDWVANGFSFDVTAIGNHNGGYAKEVSYFKMPSEFYAKTYSTSVRFIVLNSDNAQTVSAQMKFLEDQLTTATEKFIFLVYHHPTYTLSRVHTWQEKSVFQRAIRPLLWKYRQRVTAILAGHDHLAMVAQFNDLPVIISGAVQEVRIDRPINNVQDGVKVSTLWFFDNKPYWTRMSFDDSSDEALVEFVRATDSKVTCSILLKTGLPANLGSDCH